MATLESHNDYVITPLSVEERLQQTVGQPLSSWIIALEAPTPEDVEVRRLLRERYMEPYVMTLSRYKARI